MGREATWNQSRLVGGKKTTDKFKFFFRDDLFIHLMATPPIWTKETDKVLNNGGKGEKHVKR